MSRKLKFGAIIALCALAVVADSAIYFISFLLDATLLSGVAWLAWSLITEKKED